MATMRSGDSRIRDGVRDSKILRDISSKLGSFTAERNRGAMKEHFNLELDFLDYGRDLPRSFKGNDNSYFKRAEKELQLSSTSWGQTKFDEIDWKPNVFVSEMHQDGLHHEIKMVNGTERVFPRRSTGEQQYRYVDFASRFDEIEDWFHEYMEKEAPSLGVYQRNTKYESIVARFKRNFLVFDGFLHKDDLMSWIDDIEDFFDEINPPEHLKCKIVWYKMKGAAYYWWKQLQDDRNKHGKEEVTSWPRMKNMVLKRFLPAMCSIKCPNQHDEKEKEEEEKQLVADDFTHNRCSTKVPFESCIDKCNMTSDSRSLGVSETQSTDGSIENPKKSTCIATLIEESEYEDSLSEQHLMRTIVIQHTLAAEKSHEESAPIEELVCEAKVQKEYKRVEPDQTPAEQLHLKSLLVIAPQPKEYIEDNFELVLGTMLQPTSFIFTSAILNGKPTLSHQSPIGVEVRPYAIRVSSKIVESEFPIPGNYGLKNGPMPKMGAIRIFREYADFSYSVHGFVSFLFDPGGNFRNPRTRSTKLRDVYGVKDCDMHIPSDCEAVKQKWEHIIVYKGNIQPIIGATMPSYLHRSWNRDNIYDENMKRRTKGLEKEIQSSFRVAPTQLELIMRATVGTNISWEEGIYEICYEHVIWPYVCVVKPICRFVPTSVDAYLTPFIKEFLYGFLSRLDDIHVLLHFPIGTTSSDLHLPPFIAFDTYAQTLAFPGFEYLIDILYVDGTVVFKIWFNYWNFQSRSEYVWKPNGRVCVLVVTNEMLMVVHHGSILAWKSNFGSDCTQLLVTLKGHSQKTLALVVEAKGLFSNYKGGNIYVWDFENRQYRDFVIEYNSDSCIGVKVPVYASATTPLITAGKTFINPQLAHGFVSKFRGLSLNKKFILGTMCASCREEETKAQGQDVVGLNPSSAWTWVFIKHLSGLSLIIFTECQSNVTCYDDFLPYLTSANGKQEGKMDALFVVETSYTQKNILLLFMQFFMTRSKIVMFPFHPGANYIRISDEHQEYYLFHNSSMSYYMGSWNGEDTSNTEWKFGIVKRSVITFSSCSSILCDGHFKKILRLFFKLVNGLDPPKTSYGFARGRAFFCLGG